MCTVQAWKVPEWHSVDALSDQGVPRAWLRTTRDAEGSDASWRINGYHGTARTQTGDQVDRFAVLNSSGVCGFDTWRARLYKLWLPRIPSLAWSKVSCWSSHSQGSRIPCGSGREVYKTMICNCRKHHPLMISIYLCRRF